MVEEVGVYEDEPAAAREFILDDAYLGLSGEVYPKIVDVLEEIFEGDYTEAALCWGIGAGKSYAASLAITYMLHQVLCLRDPHSYYGIGAGSTISFLNMSTNGDQARRVVFGEIMNRIAGSPWFEQYEPKMLTRELRFPKSVTVICGNSAETYPLGYNVLGAVIDEVSWLLETDGGRRDSAEAIYNALQRRIRSRFLDAGLLVMISSPRHRGDFLERKLQEAEENSAIYASRQATWDMKPEGTYCGDSFECEGLEVPVEYRAEFERNRHRAMRDLGARPAEAFVPFLPDAGVLERAVDETLIRPVCARGELSPGWKAEDEWARYVHVDLGLTRDACGIAMAHCRPGDDDAAGPVVVVELMHRLVPPEDGELQFAEVRELVVELAERFPITQVSYDGYQSADSRQILRRKGLQVALVSVDRDMEAYETLKEVLNEGRLRWYRYEPVMRECKGLELVGGTKVDHRTGGSKDVADAVAAVVSEAVMKWSGAGMRAHIV